MSHYIEGSFTDLMDDAKSTAGSYLRAAKREIDEVFGAGYAEKNPSLVAAFMQTAAADLSAATTGKVQGAALQEIAESLQSIARALEG